MASYDFSVDYASGITLPHADALSRSCPVADEVSEIVATTQRDDVSDGTVEYDPILDEAILAEEQETYEDLQRYLTYQEAHSETSPISERNNHQYFLDPNKVLYQMAQVSFGQEIRTCHSENFKNRGYQDVSCNSVGRTF